LKVAKLDLASDEDFADISHVILEWREGLNITRTPQSQRRAHKKPALWLMFIHQCAA